MQSHAIARNDLLSRVPNDILRLIITFLQDEDIVKLSETSLRFNSLCKQFLNSFYGKGVRFNRWQTQQIESLVNDIENLLNDSQDAEDNGFYIEDEDISSEIVMSMMDFNNVILMSWIFLILVITAKAIYDFSSNPSIQTFAIMSAALILSIGIISMQCHNSGDAIYRSVRNRIPHDMSLFNNVTTGSAKFIEVLNKYSFLFQGIDSLTYNQDRPFDIMLAVRILKTNANELSYLAAAFKNNIQSERFSRESYLNVLNLLNHEEKTISAYSLVLVGDRNISDDLTKDSIVIKKFDDAYYAIKIGNADRTLKLRLDKDDLAKLDSMQPITFIYNAPQLLDKIVKQCVASLARYATNIASFWQSTPPRHLSSASRINVVALDNQIVEIKKFK